MTEQTSIPVSNAQPEPGPCRWCGAPSVGTVEVEKPRYRNHHGVRIVAKAALEVPACKEHIRILDHQPKEEAA